MEKETTTLHSAVRKIVHSIFHSTVPVPEAAAGTGTLEAPVLQPIRWLSGQLSAM